MEGLGRMLMKSHSQGQLKGLSLFGKDLPLIYQQFADDICLFCLPIFRETKGIQKILKTFAEASGTVINWEKTRIFFFNCKGCPNSSYKCFGVPT